MANTQRWTAMQKTALRKADFGGVSCWRGGWSHIKISFSEHKLFKQSLWKLLRYPQGLNTKYEEHFKRHDNVIAGVEHQKN